MIKVVKKRHFNALHYTLWVGVCQQMFEVLYAEKMVEQRPFVFFFGEVTILQISSYQSLQHKAAANVAFCGFGTFLT